VTLDPESVNQTLFFNITCQPFGPVSNMVLGNTVSISKTYDLNYQLIERFQANGTTVIDRTYTPDNVGNITAITDNLDATRSQSYGYDDLYRLASATGIYGSLSYTYCEALPAAVLSCSGTMTTATPPIACPAIQTLCRLLSIRPTMFIIPAASV
jgi:hypothetical protein